MTFPSRIDAEVSTRPANQWLEMSGCTYNVFQHRTKSELFCAVPVDQPVPAFILWEQWAFNQTLHPLDPCPPGFRPQAAQDGARFNGFYLFQVTGHHPANKLSRLQERGSLMQGDRDQAGLAVRAHVKAVLRKLVIV
jgi:hypothetical protein